MTRRTITGDSGNTTHCMTQITFFVKLN